VCVCWHRQQQRLKQHDGKRSELERKEKGFVLYVNGANAVPAGGKTARTTRPKSCHKTAMGTDCKSRYYFMPAASFLLCVNFSIFVHFL